MSQPPQQQCTITKLRNPPNRINMMQILYHYKSGNYVWMIERGKLTLYSLDKQAVIRQYPFPPHLAGLGDPYGFIHPIKGKLKNSLITFI